MAQLAENMCQPGIYQLSYRALPANMTTPKKQQIKLSDLLRDSAYKLTQFKPAQIQALETSITVKETGKNPTP